MATLPPAVQRQLDQAEEAERQLAAQGQAPAAPEAPVNDEPTTPAVDEPTEAATPSAEPAASEPAQEAKQPEAEDGSAAAEAKWEQRFKTLQGMHNSNMADLKARLAERDEQIRDLSRQVKESKRASTPAPELSPGDVDAFGEDMIALVKRVVASQMHQAGGVTADDLEDVREQAQNAKQLAAEAADQRFLSQLTTAVPDYEAINVDPDFLEYLGQVDPLFGAPRQAALDDAVAKRDSARTAAVFKAFLASTGASKPTPPPKPDAQAQLEKLVPPRTAAAPANSRESDPAKKVFAHTEVVRFYDELARGRYKGREQEAERMEAMINAALADGRVK